MKRDSLVIYDLVGAAATLCIVVLGLWSGLLHPRTKSGQLDLLRTRRTETQSSLRLVDRAVDQSRAEVAALEEDILRRGSLPTRSPVEADLRTIAALARDNQVELRQIAPEAERQYPGIAELKYSVQAQCTFQGLIGFLQDFQQCTFWADVTQLRIAGKQTPTGGEESPVSADLMVSLFASYSPPQPERATR